MQMVQNSQNNFEKQKVGELSLPIFKDLQNYSNHHHMVLA